MLPCGAGERKRGEGRAKNTPLLLVLLPLTSSLEPLAIIGMKPGPRDPRPDSEPRKIPSRFAAPQVGPSMWLVVQMQVLLEKDAALLQVENSLV